jgi:hypothetical protein
MGVKTRNQSGDFVVVSQATGLAAATVTAVTGYPFNKKGIVSRLALCAGVKPTGGTSTKVTIDIIKNPTNVTASAITGGTSIFGAVKPTWTWGTSGAAAGDFIEFGTYGAGEVVSTKVPAGWAVGTGLTSGVLQTVSTGDVYAVSFTLDGTATTGSVMSVQFAFDVYPGV